MASSLLRFAPSLVARTTGGRSVVRICVNTAAKAAAPAVAAAQLHKVPSSALHVSAAAAGKTIPFNLPDIGEGIAEVEIREWFVKPGDTVAEFDDLLQVESDKATVEITSRYNGVIKAVHYGVGDMAPTGSALLDIEVEGDVEDVVQTEAAPKAEAAEAVEAAAPAPAAAGGAAPARVEPNGQVFATPAVRRIARENNVDLAAVPGSGKDGRVTKDDILAFVSGELAPRAGGAAPAAPAPAAGAAAGAAAPAAAAPAAALERLPLPTFGIPEDDVRPIKGLQRSMAKVMNAAWAVPHFGYCDEVAMDSLMGLRSQLKPLAEARGVKLSYMPFIIKAASLALKQFPELNAGVSADGTEWTVKGSHNIGVAIDSPRGLIVPNIKGCQERSLFEIAHELNRLIGLAQAGKLGNEDLSGGTFTFSNIGAIGGTYASPVLNLPSVAIAALGKTQRLPRFVGDSDAIEAAHIMNVSWAADHRVVDGASMARFSNAWRGYLQDPITMVTDMR